MEFSKQEYWSKLSFLPPGDLPNPRTEPVSLASPALAGGFSTTEPPGEPNSYLGALIRLCFSNGRISTCRRLEHGVRVYPLFGPSK